MNPLRYSVCRSPGRLPVGCERRWFPKLAGTSAHPRLRRFRFPGKPELGQFTCTDDGSDDFSGSGYLFTGPTRIWKLDVPVEGLPGRDAPPLSQVELEVTLERPGRNPGMRTCYLFVMRADGTEDPAVEYGMLIGEGPVVFDVEGEPRDDCVRSGSLRAARSLGRTYGANVLPPLEY